MKLKDVTYASIVPLIGGFSIGAEKALGKTPEYIVSYSAFCANDSLLLDYYKDRGLDIPYHIVDSENFDLSKIKYVDIVTSTCPCAGLSMLNSSTKGSAMSRGSDAAQNEWMYASSRFVLGNIKPKVLIGENAPGLFTKMGQGVFDRLSNIAEEFGYSFSVVKTSTALHGIPQNRLRTFYCFWKSDTAPIMNYESKQYKPLSEFLSDVPKNSIHYDAYPFGYDIAEKIDYHFVKAKFGDDFRKEITDAGYKTVYSYILGENLLPEYKEFVEKNGTDKDKRIVAHIENKISQGLGIWDSSTHIFLDSFNAVVGRNMADAIHPVEDRLLNVREFLALMGMPEDFVIKDVNKHVNKIAQNVPTCTAQFWVSQAAEFVLGNLEMSKDRVLRQNNIDAHNKNKKKTAENIDKVVAKQSQENLLEF